MVQKPSSAKSFHRDTSGAAMVEFAIALMPLMITFSCFVQLAQLATARLVVKHATIIGARAAAVIANGKGVTPDQEQGDNTAEITQGVKLGLGSWDQTMSGLNVVVNDRSGCDDPYAAVTVTVEADYACSVPMGGLLVCLGGKHHMKQEYSFPHQGARYPFVSDGKCGTSLPKLIPDPFPKVKP